MDGSNTTLISKLSCSENINCSRTPARKCVHQARSCAILSAWPLLSAYEQDCQQDVRADTCPGKAEVHVNCQKNLRLPVRHQGSASEVGCREVQPGETRKPSPPPVLIPIAWSQPGFRFHRILKVVLQNPRTQTLCSPHRVITWSATPPKSSSFLGW